MASVEVYFACCGERTGGSKHDSEVSAAIDQFDMMTLRTGTRRVQH